jgi:hypothetical protein
MCGMNSKISTRNASSVTSRVGIVRINSASRYRGLLEGEWKCAATARPKHISVKKAAMG